VHVTDILYVHININIAFLNDIVDALLPNMFGTGTSADRGGESTLQTSGKYLSAQALMKHISYMCSPSTPLATQLFLLTSV